MNRLLKRKFFFTVDEERRPVKPPVKQPYRPRPPSPDIPVLKPQPEIARPPSPPPVKVVEPPVKVQPKPPPEPPKPPVDEGPQIYIEELQQQGTIVDAPNFEPDSDAANMRDSVKGLGL